MKPLYIQDNLFCIEDSCTYTYTELLDFEHENVIYHTKCIFYQSLIYYPLDEKSKCVAFWMSECELQSYDIKDGGVDPCDEKKYDMIAIILRKIKECIQQLSICSCKLDVSKSTWLFHNVDYAEYVV